MRKKQDILSKTVWFDKRAKYDFDYFELLQPQRIVSEHHRYKSGVFYSEKCQRNIQYESAMELNFITQLEKNKKVRFYYEQPVQITYRRGRAKSTYTPDFALFLTTNEVVIVEIKTLFDMLDNRVQMKIEGLVDFCYKKGFGLLLTDGRYNLDKLKKVKCNYKLEKAIENSIKTNSLLNKTECKGIMNQCEATQFQLLKCIIRKNLKFRSRSFRLQTDNKNQIFRHVFIKKKRYEELHEEMFKALFHSSVK